MLSIIDQHFNKWNLKLNYPRKLLSNGIRPNSYGLPQQPRPPLCLGGGRASSVYQHVHRLNHSSIEPQSEKDRNTTTAYIRKRDPNDSDDHTIIDEEMPKRKVVTADESRDSLNVMRLFSDKEKVVS